MNKLLICTFVPCVMCATDYKVAIHTEETYSMRILSYVFPKCVDCFQHFAIIILNGYSPYIIKAFTNVEEVCGRVLFYTAYSLSM